MRHFSSVTGPALPRKTKVGLIVAFVSLALVACPGALADSVTTNFEDFNTCPAPQPVFAACGTVDGQDGWKSAVPGDIPSLPQGYDQQVVLNAAVPGLPAPMSFGNKSLRISNGYGTESEQSCNFQCFPPEFHFQTYSTPTTEAAGQDLTNKVFTAQFTFISVHPDTEQPRLLISVSPDMGEGGRMSYVGLNDTPDGIDVVFYDTPKPDGDFVGYDLGTLPRNTPHTIKFWMNLVPGPNNDLVRIFIDGRDAGQCFTTWENFYTATNQSVPESDRLLFLSGNRDGDRPSLVGGGYLFDNVSVTTSDNAPPGCDVPIEKQVDTATVRAGGLAGYRITVRNRGRLDARSLLVCDRIPRHTTFVRANRRLRRLGRRRCFVIPRLRPGQRASVHLMLRVNPNAPSGNLDNTADITPIAPITPPISPNAPLLSLLPLLPNLDLPHDATVIRSQPLKRVGAIIKVLAKRTRPQPPPGPPRPGPPPPGPPPFTG